jgi:chromosome segregation ATPase
MKNFKGIQDSQNELIRNLQMQNSQLTLKLEQAQTDFAALNNAVALDKSSCETVSSELQTRSAQVAKCESNFEEFRRKVKIENLDQLQVLKDSEARLQGEIENMQDEREKLFKGVDECSKRLSEVEIEDSIKENVVKGLKNDLEYCQSSIDSAKFARTQEIEILKQDGMGLKNSIAELQKQYDENLEKMLKQSNTINELQAKIEDYEYISRRNLRG